MGLCVGEGGEREAECGEKINKERGIRHDVCVYVANMQITIIMIIAVTFI